MAGPRQGFGEPAHRTELLASLGAAGLDRAAGSHAHVGRTDRENGPGRTDLTIPLERAGHAAGVFDRIHGFPAVADGQSGRERGPDCRDLSHHAAWKDDLPKILRGALGRQQRGVETPPSPTPGAWSPLDRFAGRFESGAVNGDEGADLGGSNVQREWTSGRRRMIFCCPGQRARRS